MTLCKRRMSSFLAWSKVWHGEDRWEGDTIEQRIQGARGLTSSSCSNTLQ